MAIGVVDIGGTHIKYGVWNGSELQHVNLTNTPLIWEEMLQSLSEIKEELIRKNDEPLSGFGFSVPGMVNNKTGVIDGISAVPYIHHFPIRDELVQHLQLPVTIENDANCASIAELDKGNASDVENVVIFVVGTGVGGTVIINNQIVHGVNFAAGEFGLLMMNENNTLSEIGSTGRLVEYYNTHSETEVPLNGEEIFELAEHGNEVAIASIERFYQNMTQGIFNLIVTLNPERILIGGGISKNNAVITELNERVKKLLTLKGVGELTSVIVACRYFNDANLIGAGLSFARQLAENAAEGMDISL